jgi:hypothetical protein
MTGKPEIIIRVQRLAEAARASEAMHRDDIEARDDAIEAADLAGYTLREISDAAAMSTSHAHRITIDRAAARQRRLLDAVP